MTTANEGGPARAALTTGGRGPHIGALAGSRTIPDFQHLAGRRIAEALVGEAKIAPGRGVERPPLVAAVAEDEPHEEKGEEDGERQERKEMDHDGTGSITAAVP